MSKRKTARWAKAIHSKRDWERLATWLRWKFLQHGEQAETDIDNLASYALIALGVRCTGTAIAEAAALVGLRVVDRKIIVPVLPGRLRIAI